MKKKIIFAGLVACLGCASLGSFLTIAGICYALNVSPDSVQNLVRFVGVRKLIESRYVGDVDDTQLMDGAISGMVQSLGDPHSLYMGPQMYEQLMDQTEGSFGGIGVYMGFKDDKVTIISVMDDTPGQAAGLAAGDEIVAIDGTPASSYEPEEVALHIRGEIGTNVTLTIHREGEEDKDYTIERATIQMKTVGGHMIDESAGLGYIRISNFSENTGDEFKKQLTELEDKGLHGLIIDLRENPGGLVKSCTEVANLVVPKGPIVSIIDKSGKKEEYTSDLAENEYPIVVLIDGNSASAAEILAGALQDTGAATLVGTTSYGKGSVQVVVPMYHDDAVKLTIAKYYTPSGRSIDGTGIEPDVFIELPQGATSDVQMEKAEEVLKDKIAQ
ncbi:S41 family peptidase [uncultured Selenomonas sp.]|uniref:S41 family peptidase n=1 Tax=uncultured Selenomonas sp. TaxID=159275 RepID=UPI0025D9B282|nr:S41 family peptidase [uncultured Selenomonas sp.]